ncbi:hypothetical protein QBC34DRAFT_499275 [Podospora aff. communis PSN243]|uniref:Uncharacterized protein n=1 Tax=Podospora aff. communis PSN243 TaxID=3040156 RepID=A0AAV9G4J9_9PEZI|nr:hypothetical protein QBC34DRAFT_499275 [Podospora aff. communis PSN243]
MQLSTLFLAALSASAANAIHITIMTRQGGQGFGAFDFDHQGTWHEGGRVYEMGFASGCGRDTDIPNVADLCIDNANSRAHAIRPNGQKICFRKWADVPIGSCYQGLCFVSRWHEHPC